MITPKAGSGGKSDQFKGCVKCFVLNVFLSSKCFFYQDTLYKMRAVLFHFLKRILTGLV